MALYDHIVIGAGVTGSWTACLLAKKGYKVLLLEQFPLPHSRGSSHGQSRGIRVAYPNEAEAAMAKAAFKYWEELQREAGEQLLIPCSLLGVVGPANYELLEAKKRSIDKHNPGGYEQLNGQQLRERYPGAFSFPLDYRAIIDHKAGVLRPDKSLKALQSWFVRLGGDLVDGCKVESIQPGAPVRVCGSKGSFTGHKLSICAGPWSNDILSMVHLKMPLTPIRVVAPYFRIKEGCRFPLDTFTFNGKTKGPTSHFYSMPCVDYPGMIKVAPHWGIPVHPENRDSVNVEQLVKATTEHVKEHWVGLHPEPAIVEYCMYTMTPDHCMIVDQHPQHHHISFACGLSGTGFKMGPAIGEILCDLSSGKKPRLHHPSIQAKRFNSTSRL